MTYTLILLLQAANVRTRCMAFTITNHFVILLLTGRAPFEGIIDPSLSESGTAL